MAIRKSEINKINEYWNALNYISAAELYLMDNPLLKRKLELSDIKPHIIGHWGTVPGQNMIYAHLNRIINKFNKEIIYLSGPGHGGNAPVACTYLEGSYSNIYKDITQDEEGMKKLFKRFSFPGGISSHADAKTPGSIHEGGELGYVLSHAYGAVLDNPNLIAAAVIGDGEAETGPLAGSWNVNKFLNHKTDGAILPILHLNGFKINNPSIMSRMSDEELYNYFTGLGYYPHFVSGKSPKKLHKELGNALELAIKEINNIKKNYKKMKNIYMPMIIFRSPKGMSGPKNIVGTFKAHQVPIEIKNDEDVILLEKWLKSYKPNKLFDENGTLRNDLQDLNPAKNKLMGLNKNTNGGKILKDLTLPKLKSHAFNIDKRGSKEASDMYELGGYLKDVFSLNKDNKNFRMFGPDEAISNRLNQVFEEENKNWHLKTYADETMLSEKGRILDGILSEHVCEGALEGYLLSGRHGIFHTYESFSRVIDSMVGQHAKWLKVTNELSWREDIASLNIILSSHTWQQDHNGYTHQEPGFLNHIANKKSDITNIYLPIDANTLTVSVDHMLRTKQKVNVVVASKHLRPQWLSMDEAIKHFEKGIDVFEWASNEVGKKLDVILACAGDTPTLETIAAASILKEKMPTLSFRVVNVINLFKIATPSRHHEGLGDKEFSKLFGKNVPIIFTFHGYPSLIKDLVFDRDIKNITIKGYEEEGTITTPFDMRVVNEIDRYNLVLEAIKLSKKKNKELENYCINTLDNHSNFITLNGKDIEEVTNWKWID